MLKAATYYFKFLILCQVIGRLYRLKHPWSNTGTWTDESSCDLR